MGNQCCPIEAKASKAFSRDGMPNCMNNLELQITRKESKACLQASIPNDGESGISKEGFQKFRIGLNESQDKNCSSKQIQLPKASSRRKRTSCVLKAINQKKLKVTWVREMKSVNRWKNAKNALNQRSKKKVYTERKSIVASNERKKFQTSGKPPHAMSEREHICKQ